MKYTTSEVTFREIPDEVTLCINISNCPIHCPDCHSKELWGDIGTDLTKTELKKLIEANAGITCVCLMGGDADYLTIKTMLSYMCILRYNKNIKLALYSGRNSLEELHELYGDDLYIFDYVKVGPYVKELGGLDSRTTNQILYKIDQDFVGNVHDITSKFWRNGNKPND